MEKFNQIFLDVASWRLKRYIRQFLILQGGSCRCRGLRSGFLSLFRYRHSTILKLHPQDFAMTRLFEPTDEMSRT